MKRFYGLEKVTFIACTLLMTSCGKVSDYSFSSYANGSGANGPFGGTITLGPNPTPTSTGGGGTGGSSGSTGGTGSMSSPSPSPSSSGTGGSSGSTGSTGSMSSPSPSPSSSGTSGSSGSTGSTGGTGSLCDGACPSPSPSPSSTSGSWGSHAPAILVLNPSAQEAMRVVGNAAVTVSNGEIVVNSNAGAALAANGNAKIKASAIYVTGTYSGNGNVSVSPKPVQGAAPTPDPLAGLAAPSTAGMPVYSGAVGPNGHLQPGVYSGPITISAQSQVTMDPGIYVLEAGMTIAGHGSITGNGVMIYLAGGGLNFAGGSSGTLTGPTSGYYNGVTVFQARDNTASDNLKGDSNWQLGGVFYFPAAQVSFGGNSNAQLPMSLIVDRLSLVGNSGL